MTTAWVLGSGGLLGAALCRALCREGAELFYPAERFDWESAPELASQLAVAVQAFASKISAADGWEIYWAAGVGTLSSPEDSLAAETQALSILLRLLESDRRLMDTPGAMVFASSAGAIYAGASDDIITENTVPAPTTAYAREKISQENLVSSFARANGRVSALIARISTLYGSGQAVGKQQGLLAHIARSILRNRPVQIYVSYDTIRDYIAADDAAVAMAETLRRVSEQARVLTKIFASEHPVTIAEIISIFKRLAWRPPRIVTSASRLSGLYSRRVQFRSVVLPECTRRSTTSLLVGIAQLMMAERDAFVRGRGTSAR